MPDKSISERLDDCEKFQADLQSELVNHSSELRGLKADVEGLKDSLSKTVILAQRIFVFIRTDKHSPEGDRLNKEIVDKFKELHTQLKITTGSRAN